MFCPRRWTAAGALPAACGASPCGPSNYRPFILRHKHAHDFLVDGKSIDVPACSLQCRGVAAPPAQLWSQFKLLLPHLHALPLQS